MKRPPEMANSLAEWMDDCDNIVFEQGVLTARWEGKTASQLFALLQSLKRAVQLSRTRGVIQVDTADVVIAELNGMCECLVYPISHSVRIKKGILTLELFRGCFKCCDSRQTDLQLVLSGTGRVAL